MQTSSVTQTVDRSAARWGPSVLRWTAALLWLSNVSWKTPPSFRLGGYVAAGYEHPVLPGSAWVYENLIAPRVGTFGWVTLVVEATLVVLLVSGRFLRVAAVLGFAQSFLILTAVANADDEWYWSYLLMMALHVALLVTAPVQRPARARSAARVTVGYGALVAVAHITAGLTGDGNAEWTLFGARNDLPGDFGRNLFPGSIALGLLFVALGLAVLVLHDRVPAATASAAGWVLVAVALLLLVTTGEDGSIIGLGSRASTACMVGALGLVLARPDPDRQLSEPAHDHDGTGRVPAPSVS